MRIKPSGILFTVFILMATFWWSCSNERGEIEENLNIVPLSNSWEKAVPHQEIPEGLTSLSSESCGACHQEHYQEWRKSTHAHAWTDPQFQGELKKESSPYLCINCHIPLQNQQEYIVSGLVDGDVYRPVQEENPHFDKELQLEGINCASCHVRDGYVIGMTGAENAPHKTKKDPEHLSENLCISCHNAVAVVTPELACSFETGDEWKSGPFYGEKNCKSCHMPDTSRAIVPGYESRASHLHYFAGSGIPKYNDIIPEMLMGFEIIPDSIQKLYHVEEETIFSVVLINSLAGHKVPTGNPERFILVEMQVLSADSNKIWKEQVFRIGEEWEWYPEAKKLSDNNLEPGESRKFDLPFIFPKQNNLQLHIKVSKYRTTQELVEYNQLSNDYPKHVVVYDEYFPLKVK